MSTERLGELYETKVDFASESEKMITAFIKAARYVWDRFFHEDDIRNAIIDLEEGAPGKTPFDSVYKLESIAMKVKGPSRLSWVIHGLADLCAAGLAQSGELSNNALTGKGPPEIGTIIN